MNKKTNDTIQEKDSVVVNETRFTKKQIVTSKRYAANRDLLQVLLAEEKNYTLKEVDTFIKDFRERKVD